MADALPDIDAKEFLLWLLRRRDRLRVTGRSMVPLLQPGEEVLVNSRAYRTQPPELGDIVVARHPHKNLKLVKRVTTVGEDGSCLLSGDNPRESTDSRQFGTVPPERILGRVTCRFG
ncbi:MAG: nickel-type superoxide dismutase maturation protease [Elainellaceae cyanobacterium]